MDLRDYGLLPAKVPIPAEQVGRIQAALVRSWNAISEDADPLIEESGSDPLECMVEMACDADRLVTLGGLSPDDARVVNDHYHEPWMQGILKFALSVYA